MISCIFDLLYPHPPKPTFDLFLTYFNVFGVSGPLGGLLLHNFRVKKTSISHHSRKGRSESKNPFLFGALQEMWGFFDSETRFSGVGGNRGFLTLEPSVPNFGDFDLCKGQANSWHCLQSRSQQISTDCHRELGSVPTTPDPNTSAKVSRYKGSSIVIQLGGIYTHFCQEEGILLQKYHNRSGSRIAILFHRSIEFRGRFESPDELQRSGAEDVLSSARDGYPPKLHPNSSTGFGQVPCLRQQ